MGAAILAAPIFMLFGVSSGLLVYGGVTQLGATQWLWALIIYPVSEEIIFRGGVQGALSRNLPTRIRFAGLSIPNILTSTLFAVVHVWSHGDWLILLVFFPSIIFGLSYELSSKLIVPIALHSWYNLTGILWTWA